MAEQAVSPMMQQYFEIKKQHPDEILFYRVGDFYEMFYDDALTASRELELTLTGKHCGKEERAPMCGVPFHSYEGYVARLVAKGYKVAICEQMEDPALAKGLSSATSSVLSRPARSLRAVCCRRTKTTTLRAFSEGRPRGGLCFADVSTGTAHITELNAEKIGPAMITELCRYHPSEVLMNPGLLDCREVTAYIKKNMTCSGGAGGRGALCAGPCGHRWKTSSAPTGADHRHCENGLVRFAMAALLEYLHDTQIKAWSA